ncbi:serine threonine kinase [Stagonosporopsis vannaccii]|nr:serine threonine kinase [Stagonosporopsis vannaccii]
MRDWSETGRGQHVEFKTQERVPLKPGRMLGRGAMGDVYETTIQGYHVAWKRITSRRKLTSYQRKEIEILKKLSHTHMVQLIGTYTHRLDLGILLYPVAVCDLHTFFEDVEAHWTGAADEEQKTRLTTFNYLPLQGSSSRASPAYCQIGCLISAIEYLHSQEIRHKDLKPSNILLSPGRLWLSDFGSATDFSLLSQSATDNERGTPRYFAPEVADWQKNGRAADIFSLGCVLLEIIVLHADGTLKRIRDNRPKPNPAFHANLNSLDTWLPFSDGCTSREHQLIKEVRAMLSKNPQQRPIAQELLRRLILANELRMPGEPSIFGDCCRVEYVPSEQQEKQLRIREGKTKELKSTTTVSDPRSRALERQRFGGDSISKVRHPSLSLFPTLTDHRSRHR